MSANTPFKTDAVVKGSLNVGLIPTAGTRTGGAASTAQGAQAAEPTSEAYLNAFEEELHKKVDGDIGVLVDGLQECMQLAKVSRRAKSSGATVFSKLIKASCGKQVGDRDRFKAEQDAVETELKAESMVRVATGKVFCVLQQWLLPTCKCIQGANTCPEQVRATESLLSLSHTLKLLFLLNNEDEGSSNIIAARQDQMARDLAEVKEEAKILLAEVLSRQ